jgi:hypothetical protein
MIVPVDIDLGSTLNILATIDTRPVSLVVAGSQELDVRSIDPTTLTLAGVSPLSKIGLSLADVTCPYCVGADIAPDGYEDLIVRFSAAAIRAELESQTGPLQSGQRFSLRLDGAFESGHTPKKLTGFDTVEIWSGHPYCQGDYEPRDGNVDGADLQMFMQAFAVNSIDADLDNNMVVNAGDVAVFAANYGLTDCLY